MTSSVFQRENMSNSLIDHLLTRRSVLANSLTEPGPNEGDLRRILTVAARVPDHKKLEPWRFIVFQGEARAEFGAILADVWQKREDGDVNEKRLQKERERFMRAPTVIAAITCIKETHKVPEWEQILSTGAACQNMLLAATALGFSAQWITEWYSYDDAIHKAIGLTPHERIAGFIYIGMAKEPPKERKRPELDEVVSYWPVDK